MANAQVTQDLMVKMGQLQVLVSRLNSGGLQYHEIQEAIQILEYFAELAELRSNFLHTMAIVQILRWKGNSFTPVIRFTGRFCIQTVTEAEVSAQMTSGSVRILLEYLIAGFPVNLEK